MKKRSTPRPKKGKPKKVKPKAPSRKRSKASVKGWETRRRQEAERAAQEDARKRQRQEAGRKAWRTRQARLAVVLELRYRLRLEAEGARSGQWDASDPVWYEAKDELLAALGDFDRYVEVLEDIADDEGTDWQIAYSGSGEQ